jgi:arsenate reductase-like glutaredoxin family protein
MNIQIFGKGKCFDTKKAERYFKERGIKYQRIDILQKGLSRGELNSVIASVGIDAIVSDKTEEYHLFRYLTSEAKPDKLLECPGLYKTPIVRNGKTATVGYCPDIWKSWE